MADGARTYLDHNASSPLRPQAREAMLAALDATGNASSMHGEGRVARVTIEHARDGVAALLGARARDVVFTSGATEANALALGPELHAGAARVRFDRLLTSPVEHACVLEGARFPVERIERLAVRADGTLDLAALDGRLEAAAKAGERVLVSVQAANNETGVLQPVRAIADRVRAAGGVFHCDAAQAIGRTDFDLTGSGADLVAISAHKIGGPQGVGALITTPGFAIADRMLRGGGQERGARAGTENVAAIAGFGAAARALLALRAEEAARMARLRDVFEAGLRAIAPGVVIFGERAPRLPNTTLFAMPDATAETTLMAFDLAGLAASSGAACSSGKIKPSHVLRAMGVSPAEAASAIRISLGWTSRDEDVAFALGVFENTRNALRNRRGRAA